MYVFPASCLYSFSSCSCSCLQAGDYYVSPSGSDANPGTSTSAPWATLYTSVNRLQPGDRLIIMAGRYIINDYDHIITPLPAEPMPG